MDSRAKRRRPCPHLRCEQTPLSRRRRPHSDLARARTPAHIFLRQVLQIGFPASQRAGCSLPSARVLCVRSAGRVACLLASGKN
eukprot:5231091-Prymnesium_polylepis.1